MDQVTCEWKLGEPPERLLQQRIQGWLEPDLLLSSSSLRSEIEDLQQYRVMLRREVENLKGLLASMQEAARGEGIAQANEEIRSLLNKIRAAQIATLGEGENLWVEAAVGLSSEIVAVALESQSTWGNLGRKWMELGVLHVRLPTEYRGFVGALCSEGLRASIDPLLDGEEVVLELEYGQLRWASRSECEAFRELLRSYFSEGR